MALHPNFPHSPHAILDPEDFFNFVTSIKTAKQNMNSTL